MQKEKRKKVFLVIYFIGILALFLSYVENIPFRNILADLKYLPIMFCIFDIIFSGEFIARKIDLCCFFILAVYIVFFGLIIKNPIVEIEIKNHFIMMTIYFFLLFSVYLEVLKYQCFWNFIKVTHWIFAIFLFWCGLTHLNQMVFNPFYYISIIFRNYNRVRSTFGIIGTNNYCGHFCYVGIVVGSLYLWNIWKKRPKNYKQKMIGGLSCLIFEFMMLGSSSSRAAYTSLLFFWGLCGCYFLVKYVKQGGIILKILFSLGVGIIILLGKPTLDYIWSNSNRELNIENNRRYFEQFGNIWTGMGFVENSAFQSSASTGFVSAFGVRTTSLDMYYVYLYYTTGIVGCLMMGSLLIVLLFKLLKYIKTSEGKLVFFIYISLLYYAYWESVLFSERFWPAMILLDIVFIFGAEKKVQRNND